MGEIMHVGTGIIWKISVPYFQFCCEPQTPPKSKVVHGWALGLRAKHQGFYSKADPQGSGHKKSSIQCL